MRGATIVTLALLTVTMSSCQPDENAQDQVSADTAQAGPQIQGAPADTPRFTIMVRDTTEITQDQCIAGRRVKVDVEINGGRPNNSVLGEAWCGDQRVVANVSALDPGNGQAATNSDQGTQVDGAARCTRGGVMGQPISTSQVTCTFF